MELILSILPSCIQMAKMRNALEKCSNKLTSQEKGMLFQPKFGNPLILQSTQRQEQTENTSNRVWRDHWKDFNLNTLILYMPTVMMSKLQFKRHAERSTKSLKKVWRSIGERATGMLPRYLKPCKYVKNTISTNQLLVRINIIW